MDICHRPSNHTETRLQSETLFRDAGHLFVPVLKGSSIGVSLSAEKVRGVLFLPPYPRVGTFPTATNRCRACCRDIRRLFLQRATEWETLSRDVRLCPCGCWKINLVHCKASAVKFHTRRRHYTSPIIIKTFRLLLTWNRLEGLLPPIPRDFIHRFHFGFALFYEILLVTFFFQFFDNFEFLIRFNDGDAAIVDFFVHHFYLLH